MSTTESILQEIEHKTITNYIDDEMLDSIVSIVCATQDKKAFLVRHLQIAYLHGKVDGHMECYNDNIK